MATKKNHRTTFPAVGIGASAGGLEAFIELVKHLPEKSGLAFVFLQHTLPTSESKLDEILGRQTSIPILKITEGMKITPDFIYIVPPDKIVIMSGQVFKYAEIKISKEGKREDIDVFFTSLAQDSGLKAIGILLSGTGSDGVKGLQAIKAAGGITFAQEKESAKFPDMPEAARLAGAADYVLTPADIGRELAKLSENLPAMFARDFFSGKLDAADEEVFHRIIALLQDKSGVQFSEYKISTLLRRINRRALLNKQFSLVAYESFLTGHPDEIAALYNDVLIGTTEFFREEESFTVLRQKVFPHLIANKQENEPLRVWVPGCSTGQEVYSLAIALSEFLEERACTIPLQIFGTDINETAIDKARKGEYTEAEVKGLSSQRLHHRFSKQNSKYIIKKSLREVCVFARQNILNDPPFSNIDLLSCRNLLIYLNPSLQKRIFPILHYALKRGGFLMLGSSESLDNYAAFFQPLDKKYKIYGKQGENREKNYLDIPLNYTNRSMSGMGKLLQEPAEESGNAEQEAEQLLRQDYLPGSVLIDYNWMVVKFWGHTSPYLEHKVGRASLNIMKMIKEDLFFDLQLTISEAQKTRRKATKDDIVLLFDGLKKYIRLDVIPIQAQADDYHFWLLVFNEKTEAVRLKTEEAGQSRPDFVRAVNEPLSAEEQKIRQLGEELKRTRDRLSGLIERERTSKENLGSALEELQSANEELQSTNEELETSKEELQSSNEELITVNEELNKQNNRLDKTNNDLVNLLANIDIPVVMIGNNFQIRTFNAPAKKLLNLIDADEGRKFTDIRLNLAIDDDPEQMLLETINNVKELSREVRDKQGRWYLLRSSPYKTLDNRIDGAVLTAVDIDELKRAAENLQLLATVVSDSNDAIIVQDARGQIASWNKGAEAIYGWQAQEIIGKDINKLIPGEQRAAYQNLVKSIFAGNEIKTFETKRITRSDRQLDIWITASKLTDKTGKIVALATTERDMTDIKENLASLKQNENKFKKYFDNALEYSFIISDEQKIIDVNTVALQALGYHKEELLDRKLNGLYKEKSLVIIQKAIKSVQAEKSVTGSKEVMLMTKTGMGIPVLAHITGITGEKADILYYIIVHIDLKLIKETEVLKEDIRNLEKIVEDRVLELEKAKRLVDIGTLSATVAHELRNPLAVIATAAYNIERKAAPEHLEKVQKSIAAINKKIIESNKIINNLLFYARIREPQLKTIPVCQLPEEAVSHARERFPKQGIRLTIKCLFKQEQHVKVDPLQLQEVFDNILGNAYEALSAQPGEIVVLTKPGAKGFADFLITDNGPGMKAEVRAKAFDPFFSTKSKGTGLGLSVCRQIVEKHAGKIGITSKEGQGTTVKISLPLAE